MSVRLLTIKINQWACNNFAVIVKTFFADLEDTTPLKIPPPSYKSTPAKSTPRKRVTINTVKQQDTNQVLNENKHETTNGLDQMDSAENVAVKKSPQPTKEESSMVAAHIRFVLAIFLFLGFMIFLVYILMEETPQNAVAGNNKWANARNRLWSVAKVGRPCSIIDLSP